MESYILLVLFNFCLLIPHEAMALKCRMDNEQTNDEFHRILQICKRRYLAANSKDVSSISENDRSDDSSNSDEDMFDENSFINDNGRHLVNQSSQNQNIRDNKNNRYIKTDSVQSHFSNHTNGNLRDGDSYNIHNQGVANLNNSNQEEPCIIQCFFNELNVIDQKGFPEEESIIQLMTQNIEDPELKDFVQESIYACFQYLTQDMEKEQCKFSRNLLSCIADKGKEKCEDWNI